MALEFESLEDMQKMFGNAIIVGDFGGTVKSIKPSKAPKAYSVLITTPGGDKYAKVNGDVLHIGEHTFLCHQAVCFRYGKIRLVDGFVVSEITTGLPITATKDTPEEAIKEAKKKYDEVDRDELNRRIALKIERYGVANKIS